MWKHPAVQLQPNVFLQADLTLIAFRDVCKYHHHPHQGGTVALTRHKCEKRGSLVTSSTTLRWWCKELKTVNLWFKSPQQQQTGLNWNHLMSFHLHDPKMKRAKVCNLVFSATSANIPFMDLLNVSPSRLWLINRRIPATFIRTGVSPGLFWRKFGVFFQNQKLKRACQL